MIKTIENLCYHELPWQNWNIICNCVHISSGDVIHYLVAN